MKEIRFIDGFWKGIYFFKGIGKKAIVDNWRAKQYCKEVIDWEYFEKTGRIKKRKIGAVITKDLGLHFGRSKHIYIRDGRSKVYERKIEEAMRG